MKYNVTNVSASSDKGARNVFLTEAGKLLKAGEAIACNRIDSGTWGLEKAGLLKIEQGNFAQAPIFKDEPAAPPEDETATGPKPEDVAARKAEAAAMDQRIAAAAAKAEADAEAAKPSVVAADVVAVEETVSVEVESTPAPSSNKKSRGKS